MQEITIAAVGDILINGAISMSVKQIDTNLYDFDSIFEDVAPILRDADLTIGNLEVPLKGNMPFIKKKNPRTGFPMFNGPEPLAAALKRSGFDVMITANNHCLDNGIEGLRRTLQVLDANQLAHTGTFAVPEQPRQPLIMDVKGIKIGILAYTKTTNQIPLLTAMRGSVNLINEAQILRDLREIKRKTDLNIISLHLGQEYRAVPTQEQRTLVRKLLQHGADIILGSHPHVLQPILRTSSNQLAMYSLGNFVSIRLNDNPYTNNGLILQLTIRKDTDRTTISGVDWISTWTYRNFRGKRPIYRVIPNTAKANIQSRETRISPQQRKLMEHMRTYTSKLLRSRDHKP
ncbi:poly-gamma-glutamate synthesis protein (capsule biosynthesis protein) [Paenibacillus sp. 1_12]|uniref:CapA family protein n=1 Tax=Paenibacillus sp. 1_12 TaxID=1566278 RepID=UPI0008E43730|nr:CapA family protein [Paenibacillus sp. 1_12]SFL76114.1 poly-gamma-glutamate synthesis protein (capsule biosynthesis protein) [Paenibacillus sp. 1_12]